MVTLFSAVALSILFSIFATQNTGSVNLNFGSYTIPNIPVYLVILIPLLIGLIVAIFFHLTKNLSQSLTINEQKDELKKLKKELAEVTKTAHQFEIENAKIKAENGEPEDTDSI